MISPDILKMRAALFCIFTYLDTKTLLRAAEVCRNWRFVARHPAVWTRLLLENARISSKVQRLHTVCVSGLRALIPAVFSHLLTHCRYLFFLVPEHVVSVVHSDTLTHPAEPQTKTARQEGNQGGLP